MALRTEIYINNTLIDLHEDIPLTFTYQVADIREPENRNASFSKTLTIPGSKTNNQLFNTIYEINSSTESTGTINFDSDFNPNLNADVIVYCDGIQQFKGVAKMDNIRYSYEMREWEYDLTFYGKLYDIFAEMGDGYLHDLDFSEFDHAYTKNNQFNSLATSIVQGGSDTVFSLGNGYVYPLIDYGMLPQGNWSVTTMFPAIYVKEYIDKIFAASGFQFSSTFLTSTSFKSKIIPFNSQNLRYSDAQIQSRQFRASRTSSQSFNVTGTIYQATDEIDFNDDSTTPNNDAGGQYNTGTGVFTVATTTRYDLISQVQLELNHGINSAGTWNNGGSFQLYLLLTKWNGSSWTTVNSAQITQTVPTIGTSIAINQKTNSTSVALNWSNQLLYAGEQYRIELYIPTHPYNSLFTTTPYSTGGIVYLDAKVDSYFQARVVNNGLLEGDTVEMNNAIPRDIKQRDFLKSIIKMFNLYVEQDKSVNNKLIIEPRDDFYAAGSTKDWSSKVDLSKEILITPMAELNFKQYLATYKEDSDYYNARYKNTYGEIYGQRLYEVNNDFVKDTKKLDLIFSPTPLADQEPSNRIIPIIFQLDDNGNPSPKQSNIRILHYGGIKTSIPSYNFTTSSGVTQENYYGYAGHLDDPLNPTEDLNFYYPREIYYNGLNWTNNNLFNHYHKQFMDEITSPDAKMFTGYFNLSAHDISKLDFRDKFWFENAYWRLNKIYEYNPLSEETTKCEFIKIKNGVPYSSRIIYLYGSPLETLDDTGGILFNGGGGGSDDPIEPGNGRLMGTSVGLNNFVARSSINSLIVGGSYNNVGEYTENVNITNSSGITVFGGLKNVSVINSSGLIIEESNVVYVNNIRQDNGSKGMLVTSISYSMSAYDSFIKATSTGITITLPQSGMTNWQKFTIKRYAATAGVVTISGGALNVDGGASTTLASNLDAKTLMYYNAEYFII